MKLVEAFLSAHEGNFVSHRNFDRDQSMHSFGCTLFYEDGANLSATNFEEFLEHEEWAQDGWYVKCPKERVDLEKLEKLHGEFKGRTLPYGRTYEECLLPKTENE